MARQERRVFAYERTEFGGLPNCMHPSCRIVFCCAFVLSVRAADNSRYQRIVSPVQQASVNRCLNSSVEWYASDGMPPCELIEHGQPAQASAGHRRVGDEIPSQDVVAVVGFSGQSCRMTIAAPVARPAGTVSESNACPPVSPPVVATQRSAGNRYLGQK